jgi:hypothetical protein
LKVLDHECFDRPRRRSSRRKSARPARCGGDETRPRRPCRDHRQAGHPDRHSGRSRWSCGTGSASGTRSPTTSCRGRVWSFETLLADWQILSVALLNTLKITFGALLLATAGGLGLSVLFTQSKWIEISFFPFAVILQVTPIIAVAPLILIYVDSIDRRPSDLCLDRRLLPDPVEHHARPELRRPQPAKPLPDVRRHPLADPEVSASARRDAVFPRRCEDRRRPVAHRRHRRRIRCRVRRLRVRSCQPDPGSQLSAQHAAHVRRSPADLRDRHSDLPRNDPFVHLLLRKWHESALKKEA